MPKLTTSSERFALSAEASDLQVMSENFIYMSLNIIAGETDILSSLILFLLHYVVSKLRRINKWWIALVIFW